MRTSSVPRAFGPGTAISCSPSKAPPGTGVSRARETPVPGGAFEGEHEMAVPGPKARGTDDVLITELYRRYRAPLLSFVLRLTAGDRQHAEDIVQETMVRAWRQVGQFDDPGRSIMPWLATVARRIVIDEQR